MQTRDHYIQKHRKMWNWIAHNTYARRKCMTKNDYADEIDDSIKLAQNNCWLCEYLLQTGEINCTRCLLIWDESHDEVNISCTQSVNGMDGLFKRWQDACEHQNYREAADIAQQIADLPERPQNTERCSTISSRTVKNHDEN